MKLSKYCGFCGNQAKEEGAAFCETCGAKMGADAKQNNASTGMGAEASTSAKANTKANTNDKVSVAAMADEMSAAMADIDRVVRTALNPDWSIVSKRQRRSRKGSGCLLALLVPLVPVLWLYGIIIEAVEPGRVVEKWPFFMIYGMCGFVVFLFIRIARYMRSIKEFRKRWRLVDRPESVWSCSLLHVGGLPFASGIICDIHLCETYLEFAGNGVSYSLPFQRVVGANTTTQIMLKKGKLASRIRAAWAKGEPSRSDATYLVLTYRQTGGGVPGYITFDVGAYHKHAEYLLYEVNNRSMADARAREL